MKYIAIYICMFTHVLLIYIYIAITAVLTMSITKEMISNDRIYT